MRNGKYYTWGEDGTPVPTTGRPYTKNTSQSLLAAALATPYEGEDIRYHGMSKGEVIALREAELAADGDMEAIKDINDRMMGKPKQTTETMTITASLQDFLTELDDREKASQSQFKITVDPVPEIDHTINISNLQYDRLGDL